MGVVYEVRDPASGAPLAVKTLLPGPGGHDPDELARLRREAEVLGRLAHPHVVRVHAADLDGATPWLALDLLPGGSLQDRLARGGPLPVAEAVAVARKLASALEHAHARGILHRDLKPANVLLDDRGEPRLVDFGLGLSLREGSARLTRTGEVVGTPAFMAPEQVEGSRAEDARTDVYGLGATLFALLTGRAPFVGAWPGLLEKLLCEPAPAPSSLRPDVPAWLDAVVARALAKDPADRFPSAAALELALASPAAGRPRPFLVACVAGVAVVVGLVAALAWTSRGSPRLSTTSAHPAPVPSRSVVSPPSPPGPPPPRSLAREEEGALRALVAAVGSGAGPADVVGLRRAVEGLPGDVIISPPLGAQVAQALASAAGTRERWGDLVEAAFQGSGRSEVDIEETCGLLRLAARADPDIRLAEVKPLQDLFSELAYRLNNAGNPGANVRERLERWAELAGDDPDLLFFYGRVTGQRAPLLRALELTLGKASRAGPGTAYLRGEILSALRPPAAERQPEDEERLRRVIRAEERGDAPCVRAHLLLAEVLSARGSRAELEAALAELDAAERAWARPDTLRPHGLASNYRDALRRRDELREALAKLPAGQ
jgi:hypothetical protein